MECVGSTLYVMDRGIPAVHKIDIPPAIGQAWSLGTILAASIPETGTVHRTLLLQTTRGQHALRCYRYADRARIAREHALIAFAHAHSLPVPAPCPLSNGATILEQDGHYYALFPHASGRHIQRADLGRDEIEVMATFLGTMHGVLQRYPVERVEARSFAADLTTTLARIDRIERVIRARPEPSEIDRIALVRLAGRRHWLLREPSTAVPSLANLPVQVIHGDYQETNLFFAEGRVSAVIDWDQAYAAPRAWEVMRVLHLVCAFALAPSQTFLRAYRTVQSLPLDDLRRAAACYCSLRTHDLWVYEATYLEGNERARAFIQPGTFVPLEERWARLQTALL